MTALWPTVCIAGSLAAGGWGAHVYLTETYAPVEEVKIAGAQVQFVLDRQIAATIGEIAYLERKQNKTAAEIEQLRYLRKQLDEMRQVRRGK